VARALAPVRLRSSRQTKHCGVPGKSGVLVLGLLRSPAGASSLATGFRGAEIFLAASRACGAGPLPPDQDQKIAAFGSSYGMYIIVL